MIPDAAPRTKKRTPALIVDSRAEVFRLLRKCSLKRELALSRTAEPFDALPLIRELRARLIIINESFPADEEYHRYFEICRAIEPGMRLIYLGRASRPFEGSPAYRSFTRSLAKPLNIEKLEESVRELLGLAREPHTYKADSSR
jgi:DNA-binding NtrC family response regulator